MKLIIFIFTLIFVIQPAISCRGEVCRRSISSNPVQLNLDGCSGRSLSWMQKLSYCLNVDVISTTFRMMDWYKPTSDLCLDICSPVLAQTTDQWKIHQCVQCFLTAPGYDDVIMKIGVTTLDMKRCIEKFVYSDLSSELPKVRKTSNRSAVLSLPKGYTSNKWFSIVVNLPCKPPVFKFWNSMCLNSFRDHLTTSFIIAQNKLMRKSEIDFYVEFGSGCYFDIDEIDIQWDKSVPGFALPQISPLYNFGDTDSGLMFFDSDSFQQLIKTNKNNLHFLQDHKLLDPHKSFIDHLSSSSYQIGFELPCHVDSFQIIDSNEFPATVTSSGRRYLITKPTKIRNQKSNYRFVHNPSLLNFYIKIGRAKNGAPLCSFDLESLNVVVDPKESWLTDQD